MAIDTAAKRASAMAVGVIGMAVIYPDGSDLDEPQRQAAQGLYSGIAAATLGGLRPLRKWLGLRPFHLGF